MWRLKIFCSVLYIVLLFSAVYAVEYKVVLEKEFDREIKNVIFASEDGKMYPKVIVFKDKVCFLTSSSEVKTIIPREYECKGTKLTAGVYFSNNGEYVLLTRFFYGEGLGVIGPKVIEGGDFKLYNSDGKLVWIENEPIVEYEESYCIRISNRGVTAIVRASHAKIDLYDLNGNCKTITLFGSDLDWTLMRKIEAMWSEDGLKFAILANKYPLRRYKDLPGYSNEPWLILYEENGEEIWRRPIEEYISDFIYISPSGRYLLVKGHTMAGISKGEKSRSASLYDSDGTLIIKFLDIAVGRFTASSSPDEKFFTLANRHAKTVKIIESKTGKCMFGKEFEDFIEKVFLTQNGELVVSIRKSFSQNEYKERIESLPPQKRRAEILKLMDEFNKMHNYINIFVYNLEGELLCHKEIPGVDGDRGILQAVSNCELGIKFGKKITILRKKNGDVK